MSDAVQQIKDKLSIVDIITPYVELHKAGKNYKGKSPFSAEKTPSFYVSPDRGMYYCFSTSQGGDMFNFIQAMEGVDFKEALVQLADKAGIELVKEDPKKRTERDRWHAALEDATKFYQSELEKETEAYQYLKDRGVTAQTVAAWQIGYAPGPPKGGWREVKDALEPKGYTAEELLTVGLIKKTEGGKEPFDVFRDRIVFPMSDTSGKVVAFSGRILHPNDKAPKYVNSPETPLYKKSDLLYGYDKAKTGIRTLGFSLVVEGQFDVVMAHQAGYHNTVAVSGTALTLHHVQLLQRLSEKVVLALDSDRAGIAAMKKSAELMLTRGMDVKVVEMPEGNDPADMIKADLAEFKKLVGKSVHIIEFLLHVLKRSETDSRALKLKAREEILPFVLLLPNRIDQEHFVAIVAEEIGSTTEAIRFEVDRLRDEAKMKPAAPEVSPQSVQPKMQTDSARSAYLYLTVMQDVAEPRVVKIIKQYLDSHIPPHTFAISDSEKAELSFSFENQIETMPKLALEEDVISKLNFLRKKLLEQKHSVKRAELILLEQSSDTDAMTVNLKEMQEVQQELRQEGLTIDIFEAS
ncbi:MAG: DNA primase [Candidatus Paceibacteria bacterium]|jgi:DNA primase